MYKKFRLTFLFIIIIPILIALTGCYERPNYTEDDYVKKDLLKLKGKATSCDIFNGVIRGGWVYYSNYDDNQKIYKIKLDGTGKTKLNNHSRCKVIDVQDECVYYNDGSFDYDMICSMDLNGGNKKKIIGGTFECRPHGLYINEGWIYYCEDMDLNSINRIRKDGSDKIKLNNGTAFDSKPLYNNFIYYIDIEDRNIYQMNLDGTNKTKLYGDEVYDFRIVNDYIFCLNSSFNENIYRINLDGSNKTNIINKEVRCFDISKEELFYNDEKSTYRANLDGTNETYICDMTHVGDIWVVGNWLYSKDISEHEHLITRQKIREQ